MFMLNNFCVYFIILGMCADKPDPSHLVIKIYLNNKPVSIPFYIENNPVVSNNTCTWIFGFYFIRICPLSFCSLLVPRFQLLFAIIVFCPKFSEYLLGNYPQLYCFFKGKGKLPNWEVYFVSACWVLSQQYFWQRSGICEGREFIARARYKSPVENIRVLNIKFNDVPRLSQMSR